MATPSVIARPDDSVREAAARRELKRAVASKETPATEPRAYSGEDRYRMIAEAAYFRAECRGFDCGSELDDWLAAEVEVDEILAASGPRASA